MPTYKLYYIISHMYIKGDHRKTDRREREREREREKGYN